MYLINISSLFVLGKWAHGFFFFLFFRVYPDLFSFEPNAIPVGMVLVWQCSSTCKCVFEEKKQNDMSVNKELLGAICFSDELITGIKLEAFIIRLVIGSVECVCCVCILFVDTPGVAAVIHFI